MAKFCIQCGKEITTGFQTKFCTRQCWDDYKKERSLSVSPERQATVFLKTPLFSDESEKDKRSHEDPGKKSWKHLSEKNLKSTLKTSEKDDVFLTDQAWLAAGTPEEKIDLLKKELLERERTIIELQKLVTHYEGIFENPSLFDDKTAMTDEAHPQVRVQEHKRKTSFPGIEKKSWWRKLRFWHR